MHKLEGTCFILFWEYVAWPSRDKGLLISLIVLWFEVNYINIETFFSAGITILKCWLMHRGARNWMGIMLLSFRDALTKWTLFNMSIHSLFPLEYQHLQRSARFIKSTALFSNIKKSLLVGCAARVPCAVDTVAATRNPPCLTWWPN